MLMNKEKFGTKYYYPTLKSRLSFEIKSLIGRLFSPSKIISKKNYLELGAGNEFKKSNKIESLDFYNISLNNLFSFKNRNIIGHDLRYRLPFRDNSFLGVYLEHTLEHLYPFEAINLLSEIYRILKPNGIVRITVPDLDIYILEYNKKNRSPHFDKFENGCELIWSLTQNFNHYSVWNFEMLKIQLEKKKFKNVVKVKFNEGEDSNILLDREDRKHETLYVEAKKFKIN